MAPPAVVEVAAALAVGMVMVLGSVWVARGEIDGPTLLSCVAALLLANRPLQVLLAAEFLFPDAASRHGEREPFLIKASQLLAIRGPRAEHERARALLSKMRSASVN